MYNILVCDDERDIVSALRIYLTSEGYKVYEAYNGEEALALIEKKEIHLVLMDVMMPVMDGITAMVKLREKSNVPVIMLTAKSEDTDKVLGLNIGADDYVTKPFHMSVFQKKLAALLGRIAKQSGGDCYDDGFLFIDFSEMDAAFSGEPIVFTPLEYRLLRVLVKNPKVVLTRQVLLEKLWDADGNFVDEHALTAAVSRVRTKIEKDGRQYIKTVYGMAYMWIGGIQK